MSGKDFERKQECEIATTNIECLSKLLEKGLIKDEGEVNAIKAVIMKNVKLLALYPIGEAKEKLEE